MSIEFDRRSFLKAGAAAAALGAMSVVLTGCDNNSSNDGAPAINKSIQRDPYNVDGVMVEISKGHWSSSNAYYEIMFDVSNPSDNGVISLYRDSFSASYNGTVLNLLDFTAEDSKGRDVAIRDGGRIDLTKDLGEVSVTVKFTGFPANISSTAFSNNCIFKFHYKNKSIKFQGNKTSGVYTDKITL